VSTVTAADVSATVATPILLKFVTVIALSSKSLDDVRDNGVPI
jgi:hypothetical protein